VIHRWITIGISVALSARNAALQAPNATFDVFVIRRWITIVI
jgi:hypothetical protein